MYSDKNYILFALEKCEEAIDNKIESMFVGFDEDENDSIVEYHIKKDQYLTFIDILLEYAIDEEEYEVCDRIHDIKNKFIETFNLNE